MFYPKTFTKPAFHFIQQLKSPSSVRIAAGGVWVTLAIAHYTDAIIISGCFHKYYFGFVQENRASNALHALKHYITDKATVIREAK